MFRNFFRTVTAIIVGGLISIPTIAGTTWDMPIVWPDGNFHVQNARVFAEEVNKATGGEVTINIHPVFSTCMSDPVFQRAGSIPCDQQQVPIEFRKQFSTE